jgi:hypothetical protein
MYDSQHATRNAAQFAGYNAARQAEAEADYADFYAWASENKHTHHFESFGAVGAERCTFCYAFKHDVLRPLEGIVGAPVYGVVHDYGTVIARYDSRLEATRHIAGALLSPLRLVIL